MEGRKRHKERKKVKKTKDEQVGVKLPFSRLASSIIMIIISGLFPCSFVCVLYFHVLNYLAPSVITSIAWVVLLPAFFWAMYYLYLGITVLVTKAFLVYFDRQCELPEGVIQRQFKDPSHPDYKILHFYHMRGAIIKYALWITQKSPFPGMVHKVLVFFGHNQIGRHVIYENCFLGLEFAFIGDGAVIETGAALSTHVVESLYGNLWIKRLELKRDSTTGVNTIIGPGIIVEEDSQVGDNCMAFMNWPLVQKEGNSSKFFNGSPAKQRDFVKFFAEGDLKKQYLELLGNSKEHT
ncbi:hypothetical protein GF325_18450 [Candidatus Bathyarchaeota archaeon]|nr:hypothetical protein [Candidatus Bathyarchaeota archaeon]